MSTDKTVRDAFLDTVLNQIETGDPPETKATYERLIAEGIRATTRCSSSPRRCASR